MAKQKPHPLVLRASVAESVGAKYRDQLLDWGRFDCARMAHDTLRGLGLDSPFDVPAYSSERGALKAMRRAGFKSLEAAMDAVKGERIAPAKTLPADIVGFREIGEGFGMAIGLVMSAGRAVAFVDDPRLRGVRAVVLLSLADAYVAWRLAV